MQHIKPVAKTQAHCFCEPPSCVLALRMMSLFTPLQR